MKNTIASTPGKALSILVIDDDKDDIYIVCDYLKSITDFDITIDTEINYAKAEQRIAENKHDLYFVDYLLGIKTGLDLIQASINNGNRKPFILLTGKGYHTVDMQAAQSGAYDYLVKGEINSELLERSIRYSLERYKSYVSLLESETRYKEIFSKSKDSIFLAAADGSFIDFNEALTGVLGYSGEELRKMKIDELFTDPQQCAVLIIAMEAEGEVTDMEISLNTKDNEPKHFIASGIRIASEDGTVVYQGLLHDYTERKRSEKEKVQTEKIGAISRLVSSLAHEIRNPLTNINLAMEQLKPDLSEDNQMLGDIVVRNSKRINDLISDLVNLSKAEKMELMPLDIKFIMDATLGHAIDRINLKGIALETAFPKDPVFVQADIEKVKMAFLNIIINAVEAMEEGCGKLEIHAIKTGTSVFIKIRDNGCGISAESIPYLFEPYYTQKQSGTGLGLSTTHNIIQQHKGQIDVKSEPGKGTEFVVRLPIAA